MAELADFDPASEYKTTMPLRFAGHALFTGAVVDKTLLGDAEANRVLKRMYEQRRVVPIKADEVEALGGASTELTDTQQARIDDLVQTHNRDELNALAKDIPGAAEMSTKKDVATAIVRAESA